MNSTTFVEAGASFHRQQCLANVVQMLQGNDSYISANTSLFISSDPTNPIFTLDGCEQLCGGPKTGWYPDAGPRLVTRLLPIILLIFNMQFASIGMQRSLLILHLLGDPIDSTWSLLAKLVDWNRYFALAQDVLKDRVEAKSLAVIFAAADDIPHALDHALGVGGLDRLSGPDALKNKVFMTNSAQVILESKDNEILRTLSAVALYVFQVLAAFVPAVGAASTPSGGRIGTAMLLSWLLPVVLLSNSMGDFGSMPTRQRIIFKFVEQLGQYYNSDYRAPGFSVSTLTPFGLRWESTTFHEDAVARSGAIYSYRPAKPYLRSSGWKLALISVLPVAIAFAAAFPNLDTDPAYFSCRHLLLIAVFGVWLTSATATSLLSWASFATGKYLWYIMLIKDTIIAIPVLALIIVSCCGLWNTCYCWSGALVYGEQGARAQLNPTDIFDRNNNVIYPAMVGTCLTIQACILELCCGSGGAVSGRCGGVTVKSGRLRKGGDPSEVRQIRESKLAILLFTQ